MATKGTSKAGKKFRGFSDFERSAMKERFLELKAEAEKKNGASAVLARIAKMPEPDRGQAKRIHAIVTKAAPSLTPRLWYGMPAYANAAGKIVCFFQDAKKFKARYATLGFSDSAMLDAGNAWPTSFALWKITPGVESDIRTLVKKAVR